jgi:hypothetical protein
MPTQILAQYNIPRFVVGQPGKQNRTCTGEMTITPGLTHPFEFVYSNSDGVPLNLSGFKMRLVFWYPQNHYELLPANFSDNIVLAKDLMVEDSYCGTASVLLTDQETLKLGHGGRRTLRFSIYMIDTETGNTFGAQITSSGELWGVCHLDRSGLPIAEVIKGATIST